MRIQLVQKIDIDGNSRVNITVYKSVHTSIIPRVDEHIVDDAFKRKWTSSNASQVKDIIYDYDEDTCQVVLKKIRVDDPEEFNTEIELFKATGWYKIDDLKK
ncbi:hypothetical protein ABWW58_02620 [Sporolactobacillus sp. STCC-11]|uniref:hypothetical protein n=1 Tax=Sporolactobacillus caesalpiniae TaxID=3230362 RepID=UPI003399FC10